MQIKIFFRSEDWLRFRQNVWSWLRKQNFTICGIPFLDLRPLEEDLVQANVSFWKKKHWIHTNKNQKIKLHAISLLKHLFLLALCQALSSKKEQTRFYTKERKLDWKFPSSTEVLRLAHFVISNQKLQEDIHEGRLKIFAGKERILKVLSLFRWKPR